MSRPAIISLLLLSTCLLSSCFDIREDIWLEKNGSGRYSIALDMSELFSTLDAGFPAEMTGLDQILAKSNLLDFSVMDELKKTKGVSHLYFTAPGKHVYQLSMDYEDIDALNRIGAVGNNDFSAQKQFAWKKKHLIREGLSFNLEKPRLGKLKKIMDKPIINKLFDDAGYTTVYHLPGAAKKVSNQKVSISEDKRTVTLRQSLKDLFAGKCNNGIDIRYRRK